MVNLRKKSVAGAAVIVMSSIVVSRLTGFIREMLIPNIFEMGKTADAYASAFKITGLMFDMLVGGAIAAALIPVLTGYLERDEEEEGWRAAGTFINIVFIAMLAVSLLGILFAPQLVPLVGPGFDEETRRLTARLMRILFPSVAFLMLAGLCNGVLNAYRRFAAAAYGPTLYNLGSVLSIFFLSRFGIEMVAVGVMCSSAVYFLFQLSFALKNLKYYRFKLMTRHEGFRKLFRLAIPSLVSSSVVQVNVIISAAFASLFGAGNVIAYNVADRLWQLPYGIFAQGIGIAMLPTLSAKLAVGELKEYKSILNKGLKSVLLLSIPSAFGFIMLREPIIRTLLKFTRRITESDVSLTSSILAFFSIALMTHSIVAIMNRAFYAANDTRTPLFIGLSSLVVNVAINCLFFSTTGLGSSGMALSYSLASLTNAVLLMLLLNRKMKGIGLRSFLLFLFKVFAASLAMAVVLYFLNQLPGIKADSKILQLLALIVQVLTGAGVYFAAVLLLKVDEAVYAAGAVVGRVKILVNKCKNFQKNH